MNKLGGSGLIVAAIILIFLGLVLRWDLIKWLIDLTGLILIIVGILLMTGRFAMVSSSLADMGQWIELEMP